MTNAIDPTRGPAERSGARAARFEFLVRVYYEDTDTGGIVFYANYLKFFERARTEWLRAGRANGPGVPAVPGMPAVAGLPAVPGVSQQRIADELGLMFVVRSTQVDYRRPARLDDTLRIVSSVARLGRVGIDFHQEAHALLPDGGVGPLIAAGRIQVACVARATMKPAQVPDSVRAIFLEQPTHGE